MPEAQLPQLKKHSLLPARQKRLRSPRKISLRRLHSRQLSALRQLVPQPARLKSSLRSPSLRLRKKRRSLLPSPLKRLSSQSAGRLTREQESRLRGLRLMQRQQSSPLHRNRKLQQLSTKRLRQHSRRLRTSSMQLTR